MKWKALIAILALLVVAAPSWAGPDRGDLEKKLFEAYWLENGKRDLDAAREAYSEVSFEADEWPDLGIRAALGIARVAARTGKGDSDELLAMARLLVGNVETLVEKFPDKYDAKVLQGLKQEIAETEALIAKYAESGEISTQIARFVEILGEGPDSRNGKFAVADLVLFGDRAVPQVAAALRAKHPRAVAGAARALVLIDTDPATRALASAMADSRMLYRAQLVKELSGGSGRHRELFEAALADPKREVRLAGVAALRRALPRHPELHPVLVSAVNAGDSEIRRSLLTIPTNWTASEILTTLNRIIVDPDPQVRKSALSKLGRLNPSEAVTPEELALVPGLYLVPSPSARRGLLNYAARKGGKIAQQVVALAVMDDEADIRRYAVNYLGGNQVTWTNDFVPALLAGVEKVVMTEHASSWSGAAQTALERLKFAEKSEENGMRLVALLGVVLQKAPQARRGLTRSYILRQLENFPAKVRLAAWDVLTRDEDRSAWFSALGPNLKTGVAERARAALDSKDTNLQVAALTALCRLGGKDALPQLVALTRDEHAKVRRRALEAALPELSPPERQKEILHALLDEDRLVRQAAIRHLHLLEGEDWHDALIEAIAKDPNSLSYTATQAVIAMGNADASRRFFARVVTILEKENARYLASMYRIAGDVLTDPMVLDGLGHTELGVRQECAKLAGKRHLLEAWPILLQLQKKDPRDPFRQSLEQIRDYHLGMKEYLDFKEAGGPDLFEKAEALSRSTSMEHRKAACYALAALKGPRALSRLLDLVQDEDFLVRAAALEALKKLGEGPAEK